MLSGMGRLIEKQTHPLYRILTSHSPHQTNPPTSTTPQTNQHNSTLSDNLRLSLCQPHTTYFPLETTRHPHFGDRGQVALNERAQRSSVRLPRSSPSVHVLVPRHRISQRARGRRCRCLHGVIAPLKLCPVQHRAYPRDRIPRPARRPQRVLNKSPFLSTAEPDMHL